MKSTLSRYLLSLVLLCISQLSWAADIQPDVTFPQVKLSTSKGDIVVELDRSRAPLTVNNFLTYVVNGDYNNTIFHRVIPGFVVQGGGLNAQMQELPSRAPVVNESGNGLSNTRGTIAMARTNDPHSATRQFYFNMADNTNLDPSPRRWGYAVFGEVIQGMNVLDAITQVPQGSVMLNKASLLPQ